MNRWTAAEGSPTPLGVTRVEEEQAYNFALYSKHATGVLLLLYADVDLVHPALEHRLDHRINKSGRIWHCRLPASEVDRAKYYAYRVEGPFDLREGHRFDADKVLLDPYARSVHFPADFCREAAMRAGRNDGRAPLGLIHVPSAGVASDVAAPARHTHDAIIYELNVKGFTQRANSGAHPASRGRYAGIVEKIPYLKELGVTIVELLPVHQRDPDEGNYWGYMTLNFFSPEQAYATQADHQVAEFRAMVEALHAAGIEVVLDVAYSHTTEKDRNGPNYSFRGIDNTTYYLLENDRSWYRNDTDCGNTVHTANRHVRKMIVDSLSYWVKEMQVDGFRFDLASIFSRNHDGSINLEDPPIISEISGLAGFDNIRLIAEAWDTAAYQLGRTFRGISWAQWNSRFRDDVRAFFRGDNDMVNALITRIYGSDDLFPDTLIDAYHPWQSINFVDCHDGFNLHDLVSYNAKHNQANGHDNADGLESNLSWNCGWEGDVGAPAEVLGLRKRQMKNFFCLLMLANGTPMFCAGDEFMHTQGGNNNPYNQDNETTWLDWDKLQTNADMFRFFKHMIAFRKRHAGLCRSRYWREDVNWYGVAGATDRSALSHTLAFCLHGASQNDDDIYVMLNAYSEDLAFQVQEGSPGAWLRLVDTALDSPQDICEPGRETAIASLKYLVAARSVVVLRRELSRAG